MLKICHVAGGRVTRIIAIKHTTCFERARCRIIALVDWKDAELRGVDPAKEYELDPAMLFPLEDGDRSDIDKALGALSEYRRINGEWSARGEWEPHEKHGRVEVQL